MSCMKTPIEELCKEALDHYTELSIQACHWNSLIPQAIKRFVKWEKLKELIQSFPKGDFPKYFIEKNLFLAGDMIPYHKWFEELKELIEK